MLPAELAAASRFYSRVLVDFSQGNAGLLWPKIKAEELTLLVAQAL